VIKQRLAQSTFWKEKRLFGACYQRCYHFAQKPPQTIPLPAKWYRA
jgi:hypothetical protein